MKNFLLFACIGLSISANAQFTVWEDDFNDGDVSDWTLLDVDGNGSNWMAHKNIQMGPPEDIIIDGTIDVLALYHINLEDAQPLPGNENNWAITPAQDLSFYSGTVELTINLQSSIYGGPQYFYVYASDTPTVESFLENEPVELYFERQTNDGTEFTDFTIDISEHTGAGNTAVYFAIVNHEILLGTGLEIDYARITATDIAGIKDINGTVTKIKQNPIAEILQLQLGNSVNTDNLKLQVYNVAGTLVKEADYETNGVAVSDLASGLYFLIINDGITTETLKFIRK